MLFYSAAVRVELRLKFPMNFFYNDMMIESPAFCGVFCYLQQLLDDRDKDTDDFASKKNASQCGARAGKRCAQ